ncbi:MAG: hypothetical protein WCT41_00595 [Candidatus Paceibacterota bacterium]|jgi:uncharacterized membrane protein YgcG
MENEKMLPLGEPTMHLNPPPEVAEARIEEKLDEIKEEISKEKTVSPAASLPGVPSAKQQQWGVVISIVIIMLMIIIGAFYAWGQRIAENRGIIETSVTQ